MRGSIRRTAAASTVLTLATALAIALPAAPASALGTMRATLAIKDVPQHVCGNLVCAARWDLDVDAFVPLAPGENLDLSTHRVAVRIWGDDPVSDDAVYGPKYITTALPAKPPDHRCDYFYRDGGFLKIHVCVHRSKYFLSLNEDVGRDEIYAGVRLLAPSGATISSAETNRVNGSY